MSLCVPDNVVSKVFKEKMSGTTRPSQIHHPPLWSWKVKSTNQPPEQTEQKSKNVEDLKNTMSKFSNGHIQTPSWNNQPAGFPGYFSETVENHAIPGFQKFFKGIEI